MAARSGLITLPRGPRRPAILPYDVADGDPLQCRVPLFQSKTRDWVSNGHLQIADMSPMML